jgi:peptidyl-prolyl cis-trans isomerase SurA
VRAEVIDRVVAVLDEEAIFLSDVERRARPFLAEIPASAAGMERERMRQRILRETLDRMIDDQLIRQAATRLHVTVTDADVDQFIERIAQERGVSTEVLFDALQREGLSVAEYRAHMETEVRRLKVLQLRVRGRINITDADLQDAYRRFVRETTGASILHAAHIFIAVPEGADAAAVQAARERAAAAARRVRAGERFEDVAVAVSEDSASRGAGGDLGEIAPGTIPESLEQTLNALADGEVSDPILGPNGWHVMRVVSRRSATPPPFEQVRERLYAAMLNREMLRQQDIYLRELRRTVSIEVRWESPQTGAR